MAKLSREERAELEAKLAADDEDDDEDDEVELTFPGGHGFRGSMRRARSVAKAHGFKLEPDPEPEPDAKDGKKTGEVKRFSGRRVS